ncbi:hypothetical protein DXA19_14415 [Firmicutes bacterium AM59-13]|jgi:hypothetical protein|nr:hypothetical protein DXA19_14415 [Firmicutes bacterium AM59-13]
MNIYKYIIKGGLALMYKSRRTIFGFLLLMVLILGALPEFHVRAEDNSQTYTVGADNHILWDRVQDGVFQYAAGSMEIEGAGLQGDAAQADVEAGTEITITLTPSKDCVLRSFMVNGQSIAVASMTTNGASYIYKTKVENADLKFEPSFEASGGNAPGPNPGTGNNICFRLEGDGISSNDYATWKNNNIEIYIGIENTYKTLQEWIGENKISVDGAEYRVVDSVDTVKVYVLNSGSGKYMIQGAGSSQENAVTWTEKGIHSIQVDKERITITWGYDSITYGEDAYLEHGTARIIQINDAAPNTNDSYGNNAGDNRGGNLVVQPGDKVTVELKPDYGYQLTNVSLNGEKLKAAKDVSTFTFTMPNTQIHFKGIFEKAEDTVDTSAAKEVTSASISNGANAAGSGNLQLTVADSTGYDMTAAQQKVAGAVSAQAVELDLNQIVAKGDGTNWETTITEFTNPITLSLGINNYDANYDYVVVRDHNGTTTALPTKVIDGKVTFETNQFSTYVIVKKEKTTAGTSTGGSSHEDSKGNDNNSSDAQPAATQAVTQELDVVPKTGEGIATYITEIMLLFGGILLITMGILLQRKRG